MVEKCEKCGETLEIGSWPFCFGGHGTARSKQAQDFAPVTYLMDKNGKITLPPGNDVILPGTVQHEARTLREIRALTRTLDAQNESKHIKYHTKRLASKQTEVQNNLEHALRAREKMSNPLAQKMTDTAIARMRDQAREQMPSYVSNAHFLIEE
jgi:hypothetical protein